MKELIIYPESSLPVKNELTDDDMMEMFEITHDSMDRVMPSKRSNDEGYREWMKWFRINLAKGIKHILIYRNGELSGYLSFFPDEKGVIYIQNLILSHSCQGDSITLPKLFAYFCREIAECKSGFIRTYVNRKNKRSVLLTEKLGFSVYRQNDRGNSYQIEKSKFQRRISHLCTRYIKDI